jgi:hypothetical protein
MVDQNARLAEYTSLRQESLQYVQVNVQIAVVTLPIAAALITFGFQSSNYILFLATVFVLLSSLIYSVATTIKMISIGAYIAAIIEARIEDLKWETIIAKKRNIIYPIINSIAYIIISSICLLSAWKFFPSHDISSILIYLFIVIISILSLTTVFVLHTYIYSKRYYSAQVKKWRRMEEETLALHSDKSAKL